MQTYHTLFHFLGVAWTGNADSWRFLLPKFVIGLIVAFLSLSTETLPMRIFWGLVYGSLLNLSLVLHIIGHILASRLVSPPMTEARITPMLVETRYDNDPPNLAGRVHVIRSLGGIALNFLLGWIFLLLWMSLGGHLLLYIVLVNFILAFGLLLPFPTIDGEVLWREFGLWRKSKRH